MNDQRTRPRSIAIVALIALFLIFAAAACNRDSGAAEAPTPLAEVAAKVAVVEVATDTPTTPPTNTPIATTESTATPTSTTTPTTAPTDTPTPSPTATATATAADTPTPEPTETPTLEPTPDKPAAEVVAPILNVRTGPGTVYDRVGQVAEGSQFDIVARAPEGDWLLVCCVDDAEVWIAGSDEYVRQVGPLDSVPVAEEIPEPPTPAPTSTPGAVAAAVASGPAPAPANLGSFGYGIQVHPGGDMGATAGAVRDLGFNWVKLQFPWEDYEGQPGQRNWPDDKIDALSGAGLNIMASIVKAPDWARNPAYGYAEEGPPQDPHTFASFVGEFAGRYCGRVQAIEVWNEQNLPREWGHEPLSASRYVQLLGVTYRAIKDNCSEMIVVSGAPTPTGAPPPYAIPDFTYLEQMYQAGLKNVSNAIGVHPSGFGNPPDARVQDVWAGTYSRPSHINDASFYFRNVMEQYRNIMIKYGDGGKQLWPTEFGWASSGNPLPDYEYAVYNSEQQQGEYISRAYQMMRDWGFVGPAFLWNLNYNLIQPGSEMAAFGIQNRPAFDIIKAMPK